MTQKANVVINSNEVWAVAFTDEQNEQIRNDLIREGKPTEDINALLIKVIDAPEKKLKRKFDRER